MKKLLLLEDDLNLHETVLEFLEEAGFAVTSCYNGEEAETALYENRFDLLLLDVNVPSPNGFELLKVSRAQGNTTPAIFLTSRNAIDDLQEGYDSGCDDYLKKPFELKELLIRIQSLLKRSFYHTPDEQLKINERFSYDVKNDTLLDQGQALHLHAKEKELLKLFMQHPNEQIAHETIEDHLWGFDETPNADSVRTYIKDLRKIFGKDSIVSIKRYGYQFKTQ